ncbi:hypothetical protein QBC37DRAFT_405579 [Rhypophila decipiens]|uniref:Uncharacterized protein n=1 Tax=Rhypophila decipiens TaxID=261697 RepID=A0AAN6XWZ1_9PEZI|nr:hypothetical protein QBC37DRAFT_405579 [Rhypophila decipiens]
MSLQITCIDFLHVDNEEQKGKANGLLSQHWPAMPLANEAAGIMLSAGNRKGRCRAEDNYCRGRSHRLPHVWVPDGLTMLGVAVGAQSPRLPRQAVQSRTPAKTWWCAHGVKVNRQGRLRAWGVSPRESPARGKCKHRAVWDPRTTNGDPRRPGLSCPVSRDQTVDPSGFDLFGRDAIIARESDREHFPATSTTHSGDDVAEAFIAASRDTTMNMVLVVVSEL